MNIHWGTFKRPTLIHSMTMLLREDDIQVVYDSKDNEHYSEI